MFLTNQAFCPICESSIQPNDNVFCALCQNHIEESKTKSPCHTSLYGDRILYAFRYVGIIRQWMLKYKYGKHFVFSRLFAQELWKVVQQYLDWKDLLLIPVPTTWNKLLQRKHHPAELIAYELHLCSQLKILPTALRKRWSWTDQSQSSSSRINRLYNPNLLFSCARGINQYANHKGWLVVDDVFTTGSTLHACKKALLKSFPEMPVVLASVAHG